MTDHDLIVAELLACGIEEEVVHAAAGAVAELVAAVEATAHQQGE